MFLNHEQAKGAKINQETAAAVVVGDGDDINQR